MGVSATRGRGKNRLRGFSEAIDSPSWLWNQLSVFVLLAGNVHVMLQQTTAWECHMIQSKDNQSYFCKTRSTARQQTARKLRK